MKVKDLYNNIQSELSNYSDESRLETEIILDKLFKITKIDLINNKEILLNESKNIELKNILEQRSKKKPLQYIFNEQTFRNFIFYVDSRVLIPRPETEILVEEVINLVNTNFNNKNQINIVDIGCGSGAITLSLAKEIKNSKVYSVDISQEALEVAKINMEKLNIPEDKVIFINNDKLEFFKDKNIKFDIIVSNPPYISKKDYEELEKNVLDHEPQLALLDPNFDGLGFYRYFAENADKYLISNGFLCFEFGFNQDKEITDILNNSHKFDKIDVIKDYSGINRIIISRLKK